MRAPSCFHTCLQRPRSIAGKTRSLSTITACGLALLAPACLSQTSTTTATHPWQKIQMPTAAEVAAAWKTPPPEYGPEPYYGLNGPVTVEAIRTDLDHLKERGFQTVTVQSGRGMKEAYLSPEYFALFKQLVAEAKKRDMRVWIVDDAGYPSGFAGGKFTTEKPELRMQALTIAQRIPLKSGDTLNQDESPDIVAATATNEAGQRIAVPVTGGKITWTAPAGSDWTVMVVGHVFRTSPTNSDTNPNRIKNEDQSIEDYLNPAATAAYMQFTHEQYYKTMPEEFGKTILGFRGDEPDYSIAGLPWTPALLDRFQQLKGYDARQYLAAMLLSQGGGRARPGMPPPPTPAHLTDAEVRAKADYYDVFSQMFRDGFFKPQGLWCAAHGVEYQVHLNHEEMELDLTRSEGDFERDMKYVEVPGIDAIWHQIWTDTISDFPRLASSAAHVYGHPRSFTESFAAYRPAPDIDIARYVLNEQLVRGINTFEAMSYPSSASRLMPRPTPRPPVPGVPAAQPQGPQKRVMEDPGWPALMQYIRRLSYAMSMGRPAASVALYLPSSSLWMNDRESDTAFVSTERMLSERQIDFDIIGHDALAADLKALPGALESMSGNRYRIVILPSIAILSQVELNRLKAVAKGGGKILFLGRTPALISGKTILDSRPATPADFTFATVETSAQLEPTPTPPAQAPATAPGPQVVPSAFEAALNRVIPTRTVTLASPDTALRINTRKLKDASLYLFFNESPSAISHTVTLANAGKIETWDPASGTVMPTHSTKSARGTAIRLDLKPYETKLITIKIQ
jgi:hypothetical protein